MIRAFPILVGLTALIAVGLVHGWWTDRWQESEDLRQAVARMETLPDDLGAWKGREYEQDAAMLEMSGAVGHYSRTFADPVTGESVLVILLVGKPARMSVHRPEHCYTAAGYDMNGSMVNVTITPKGEESAEFVTGLFSRDEAARVDQLRIFWSFYASGEWVAPSSPRLRFARERVLYKLYVLRNVAGTPGPINSDPCVRLMGELLPILDRTFPAG